MLNQCVKHSYQWLRSTIHHQSKLARVPLIHSGYKAHQDLALASYPVFSVKEHNRKGGNVKSLLFYNRLFSSPQASPRVEANDRPKRA